MGKNTRYDKLRRRIRRQHSRSRTYENDALPIDGRERIFDLSDPGEISDAFLERGPFNSVTIRNHSNEDIVAYMRTDRQAYVTIPAAGANFVAIAEKIPARYIGFLEIENIGGAEISAGDIEIQVGTAVDSVELTLMEMSGVLNIPDDVER